MAAPSTLHPLVAAMGESPEAQGMSPLVASDRQGWFLGITWGFSEGPTSPSRCLAGPWAAGKPLVGIWQPPKWLKGCQGAGIAAGAFLTRRSCHHSQPAAESSLVHC